MTSLMHVVGARPNFIKAAPVIAAEKEYGGTPLLVHTGQHYAGYLSDVFFEQLGLPDPDVNLDVGSGSHSQQTAALILSLEATLLEAVPRAVVVYGDVNSTLATAIVAAKLGIPIAHVEAGLRSFDRTMPEEINRVVTDALASLHFVTSHEALGHLAREGIDDRSMFFVGNPMIDTLERFRSELDVEPLRKRFSLPERFALATVHRPSNVDDRASAARMVGALTRVAAMLPVVLPLHPRGRGTLTEAGLEKVPNLAVVDPLPYLEFMSLVSGATLVLTDSGGVQEETTVLGVPCLTLRDNTERPITVEVGTNLLVGSDPSVIESAARSILEQREQPGGIPDLWDGHAGERIARILVDHFGT